MRDVASAVRFYVETLGLKLVEGDGVRASLLDAGDGFHLELSPASGGALTRAPAVGLAVKVPLAEAVSIYENRGVAFRLEGEGDAAVAWFRDPDDNSLYLFRRR